MCCPSGVASRYKSSQHPLGLSVGFLFIASTLSLVTFFTFLSHVQKDWGKKKKKRLFPHYEPSRQLRESKWLQMGSGHLNTVNKNYEIQATISLISLTWVIQRRKNWGFSWSKWNGSWIKKRRQIYVRTYLRVNYQKGHWKVKYHTVGRSLLGTGMKKGSQWWPQFCPL